MDVNQFVALVKAHAWIPVAAILVGLVIRLLKSDTPLPTIPPRYRAAAALGLGIVSGVLDKIASGTPWLTAVVGGLGAAATAIVAHEVVIEGARNGRELFQKKNPPPAGGEPYRTPGERPAEESAAAAEHSDPPPAPPSAARMVLARFWARARGWDNLRNCAFAASITAVVLVVFQAVTGCAWLQSPEAKTLEKQVLTDINIACLLEHATLALPEADTVCGIVKDLEPLAAVVHGSKGLQADHVAAKRAAAAPPCPIVASADAGK